MFIKNKTIESILLFAKWFLKLRTVEVDDTLNEFLYIIYYIQLKTKFILIILDLFVILNT